MIVDPPIDAVRAAFDCRPETGQLIWKVARSHRVGKEAGCVGPLGYRTISWRRRSWPAHRLIWIWVKGKVPLGEVDHINGNRADNRIDNLRDVPRLVNSKNMSVPKSNTSGILGVSWHSRIKRWHVQIRVDRISKHVGYFDTIEEAAAARKEADRLYGFHENHGKAAA